VHGSSDKEFLWHDPPDSRCRSRIGGQMHTVDPRDDRDVGAVVHEHARTAACHGLRDIARELHETFVGEIRLTDLHVSRSAVRRANDALRQLVTTEAESAAVRDQVPDHARGSGGRSALGRQIAAPRASGNHGSELGDAGERGHDTDTGDAPAGIGTVEERLDEGVRLSEAVVFPEARPGCDDQDETGLEKIGSEQKTADRANDQPPVCTRASRSTRMATSRYSPASTWSSRNTARARAVSPAVSRVQPKS